MQNVDAKDAVIVIVNEDNTGVVIDKKNTKTAFTWTVKTANKIVINVGGQSAEVINSGSDLVLYAMEGMAAYFKRTSDFGDVTNDKKIDSSDASAILSEYALRATGGSEMPSETARIADVNFDGKVDAKDASDVLEYYSYRSTGGKKTFLDYFKRLPVEE